MVQLISDHSYDPLYSTLCAPGLYAEHGWLPGEAALPARVRPRRPPPPRARHRETRGGDHQGDKLHHRQRAAQQGRRVPGGKHH